MTAGTFATWVLVGLLTGWLVGILKKDRREALISDLLLGLSGSGAASWIAWGLDLPPNAGTAAAAFIALLRAVLVLTIQRKGRTASTVSTPTNSAPEGTWRRWRIPTMLGLLSLIMVQAPVPSGDAAAAEREPIRIGEINSYSGFATVSTWPYKDGITMAVSEINTAGGVLGRPLLFLFRDDELHPDKAVRAAEDLVRQEKVHFLAGCISSDVGLALSAFAKANQILYFATLCQTSRLTWQEGHRYVAHTTSNVNQYARGLAKLAARYPYTRWAHISPRDEYGINLWEEFWSYLKRLKPDVVVVEQAWPKLGESDLDAYIRLLRQSSAEALLSGLWGPQEVAFVKQAQGSRLFERMHLFSPGLGNPERLGTLVNDAPMGTVSGGFAWYDKGLEKLQPGLLFWSKRYRNWSDGQQPQLTAWWGYVSVYVIAEAVRRAGNTDTEKVVRALSEGFEMELPAGRVIMRGCDQQAISPYWFGIVKMNSQGRPFLADVQRFHGKDVVSSCEEVMHLRVLAQNWEDHFLRYLPTDSRPVDTPGPRGRPAEANRLRP